MTTAPRRISARDNPLLVGLRKLAHEPGAYRKLGSIWLEGEHLCEACIAKSHRPEQAVVSEAGWDDLALRTLAHAAPRVSIVPDALFAQISSLESPGRIGFVLGGVEAGGPVQADVASVVLDRLQDAGNVGSILRSAAAFGLQQVVALKGTAALWSPKVLRAGMGAHFSLRLVEGVSSEALGSFAVPLVATSPYGKRSVGEGGLPWPCAWVLGHEGRGIEEAVLQRCAELRRIPQPGGEESLNVAAAAAVCFYESVRGRA